MNIVEFLFGVFIVVWGVNCSTSIPKINVDASKRELALTIGLSLFSLLLIGFGLYFVKSS